MPRKFSKDPFFEGDLTPEMIGFDDLSSRKISEALQEEDPQNAENYTHRNIFSGLPCSCGYWHSDKEEQTKVAAEEEEAPKPKVGLFIGKFGTPPEDYDPFATHDAGRTPSMAEIHLTNWLVSNGYEFRDRRVLDVDAIVCDAEGKLFLFGLEQAKELNIGIVELSPPQIARIAQEGISDAIASDLRRGIDNAVEETRGQQEDFVPDLKTNAGRKIFKQNQKIFRRNGPLSGEVPNSQGPGGPNAGLKVLERLDNLCAKNDAEGLLPWLVARLAKNDITPNFGARGEAARGDQIGLNHGTTNVELLFGSIATWFNARQSPFRQGKNVMEMDVDQAWKISDEHLEWVRSQEMIKQYSKQLLEDETSKRKEDELQRANTPPDQFYNPMVVDLPQAIEARNMQVLEELEDAKLRGETSRDEPYTMEDLVERGYPGIIDPEKYKGWRAVQITTAESARLETAILGHCIGSDEQPYVYGIAEEKLECFSLRDPDGIPKATWNWNPEDNSLGHIQGRSGYPKEEWRELISAFNNFTGRDDDGGGQGNDSLSENRDNAYYFESLGMYDWAERAGGITNWDFGSVEEIDRAEAIMDDPWDVIRQFSDDNIDDECTLEADPIPEALAMDAVENYHSFPETFIGLLSEQGSYGFYGMNLNNFIKEILDYWAGEYERYPRYITDEMSPEEEAQYSEAGGEVEAFSFDEEALKREVADEVIDERFLNLIQLRTPPGKDPMAGEYKDPTNPQLSDEGRERINMGLNNDAQPGDYTAPPPVSYDEFGRRRDPDPFDKLPLTENQPVTVQQYNRELEEVPFGERMGEPMYNTFVEPRNNPADIAREYSRIWTNEGQSAANKWYYENYPNAQPVNQQLTSGWNGLMHS